MVSGFEEAWQRFAAMPRTKPSLAARPPSDIAGSDYLVFLIALDHEPAVAEAAGGLQARLDLPYVNPVPPTALHITVQNVGPREALSAMRRSALVERAGRVLARLAPFEVTIGGANSFDVAAFLEVHDGGVLRDARAELRAALPWLAEGEFDPLVRGGEDVYLPHVSIAYYNAEANAPEVVAALAAHRHETVARVRVESASLVAVRLPLSPTGLHYRFEASFQLGARGRRKRGRD